MPRENDHPGRGEGRAELGEGLQAVGVGQSQIEMNIMALVAGGGVRIGLEDNIWYDAERTRLATNRDLVERLLSIARSLGKEPFTRSESRKLLGL